LKLEIMMADDERPVGPNEWGDNWWLRAVVMNLMFQQRIALFGIEMRCGLGIQD